MSFSMANTINQFMISLVFIMGLLIMASLDFTVAQLGICYGRLGDNLPPPSEVVALCKQHGITRMRIFDPYQPILEALGGSDIELTIGVANEDLQSLSGSPESANTWVDNNIRKYPNVRFRYIAVGNEISPVNSGTAQFVSFVLPAMQNIHNAIAGLGVKVTTAVDTGLLGTSYPPANGAFRAEVSGFITPIAHFLASNGAPLLVNVYPYFAYINNKADIDISYALGTSEGVVVPGGVKYQNLFYAIVDAVYSALEKSGAGTVQIVVSETGWPSDGGDSTTLDNAKTYNTNLVQHVKSGTPKRPGAIETYIFDLIDEDEKTPNFEKHWGVFLPNKEAKYEINFN